MRSRLRLSGLSVVTIAAGLATRRFPDAFPHAVVDYGGDILWATLVFWLVAWLRPGAPSMALAAAAGLFSILVELSQLLAPPWLVAVRATRMGALVLGQGFLASDLVCYAAGVGLAWWLDARGVTRNAA